MDMIQRKCSVINAKVLYRFIALLLVICTCVTMLAACNKADENATDSSGESNNALLGQNPVQTNEAYKRDGNCIYFGEYPQTVKADSVNVGETADSRGYYLGSDGNYYAKITSTNYSYDVKFSTGVTVKGNTEYYFKVEPIKWRILSESDGVAFIFCENIIDNKRYHKDKNNYMNSEVRAWLNNEFYNNAFTASQQALIQTTEVDNSVGSTGNSPNKFVCQNTNDKIFLPSFSETNNPGYGFNSAMFAKDTARRKVTSDYSRARFCVYAGVETGEWWSRSPYGLDDRKIRQILPDGSYDYTYTDAVAGGVVPALKIRLQS